MVHLATAERILDARGLGAAEWASAARLRFDELAPGERFVLVSSGACGEALRLLQADRPGLFEWSPLEMGPSSWRIEIARRENSATRLRRIAEALAWDHDRLDALELAAFRARADGDLQSAFDLYAEFAAGLSRHIGFEERIVFPVFEDRAGLPPSAGPTAMMRTEHRRIRDLLDQIDGGIGDPASAVEDVRRDFLGLLGEHNLKEERVLYPAVDRLLDPEEADRLVRQIQIYPG